MDRVACLLSAVVLLIAGPAPAQVQPGSIGLALDAEGLTSTLQVPIPSGDDLVEFQVHILAHTIPGGMDTYEFEYEPDLPPGVFQTLGEYTHGNGITCPEFGVFWCSAAEEEGCFAEQGLAHIATITHVVTSSAVAGIAEFAITIPWTGPIQYMACGESSFQALPVSVQTAQVELVSGVSSGGRSWGQVKALY